jgi:superoxide dismutase, Cu-Zn family
MTRTAFLAPAALLLLVGCSTVADLPSERLGSAMLARADGTPVGTAQLLAEGDRLSLAVALTGIPAGTHGFHLHTTGKCTAPDFASAGGHLNPLGKHHGALDPRGSHLGDLPNVAVGANRSAALTADLEGSRRQVLDWLFDTDGTAVVLHAEPDDYRTDPSGNAGPRIACGVLRRE